MNEQNKSYKRAGVDITAGQRATALMTEAVRATYGPEVLAGIGAFGGLYSAARLLQMTEPVLVASTDGVGTKTAVAARMGTWETIGRDIVNHCINDVLVQGAYPLFFLDYVAASVLEPEQVASVVRGMALACREAGCALIGGETAEMPGIYAPGQMDIVGTLIGVVERSRIIDGLRIRAGDVLLALPATGLHTNGYSLARAVLEPYDWQSANVELGGQSIGEALLAVHRSYLRPVRDLLEAGITIHGMAHITGGGLIDNLPRVLPEGLGATVQRGAWREPPIFAFIQQRGGISTAEMFHVFNMGVGMVVIVPREQATRALATLSVELSVIGEVVAGQSGVAIT
ncbi:MAG: phosphoribosylformylglycinamidine cyclo-ligase [Chloroflexaceae bacterium]|nr:phosphoribosylformylglycinamidine cyclo-ligase [Chloroflexaceae bacterium]